MKFAEAEKEVIFFFCVAWAIVKLQTLTGEFWLENCQLSG